MYAMKNLKIGLFIFVFILFGSCSDLKQEPENIVEDVSLSKSVVVTPIASRLYQSELMDWFSYKQTLRVLSNHPNLEESLVSGYWSRLELDDEVLGKIGILIQEDVYNTKSYKAFFLVGHKILGEFNVTPLLGLSGEQRVLFENSLLPGNRFMLLLSRRGEIALQDSSLKTHQLRGLLTDLEVSGELIAGCIDDAYSKHGWASVAISIGSILAPKYVGLGVIGTCIARNLGRPSNKGGNTIF